MKTEVRRDALARRAALSPEERRRQSRAVQDRLRTLPPVHAARTLLGYWPTATELDPVEFLQEVAPRKRVVLPRLEKTCTLHVWRPGDELDRSSFGVLEPPARAELVPPDNVDLVLVPGVAFDRSGHRLGRGGGHYDRLLATLPNAVRVGLAFDEQIVNELPHEAHDVRMEWIVAASGVIRSS